MGASVEVEHPIVRRLRDRAATSRGNAQTYEASGYLGEAFAARERAKAFDCAAEDAALLLSEPSAKE